MSEYGRYAGPRFAPLEEDYKICAVYCSAKLIKEKVWAAVVTDRPASGSGAKSKVASEAWDIVNELVLETTQISVKPVRLCSVTAVSTAKEAWDALQHIFEARDNARLPQLSMS